MSKKKNGFTENNDAEMDAIATDPRVAQPVETPRPVEEIDEGEATVQIEDDVS